MNDDQDLSPEFSAGDRIRTEIGDFEVQQVLGSGGMGVVYQVVRDQRHGARLFALKIIKKELNRPEVLERFEAEGRILSQFDHENIIRIDGIFNMLSSPVRPFILMELLQGFTLKFMMEEYAGPIRVPDVCTVAIGICNALDEIHKHNVVHRDIKPENIFIQKRRKQTRIVLIDFGIMKQILKSGNLTSRYFLGTYTNAAPEQLLGKEVSPRTDFYSLAIVLYEMITGGPLFPDLTDAQGIGRAHVDRRPTPLHEIAPHIPKEILDIVMQALSKDPAARPKDAHAFRQPFTNVRNRLVRDQAPSAGHSTIERLLANTVGADRVPIVSLDPGKGDTARLAALRPELNDTTAPSGAPCEGTEPPDQPLVAVGAAVIVSTTPGLNVTPPPAAARTSAASPVAIRSSVEVVKPAVEAPPSAASENEWDSRSAFAAMPIQPPLEQPLGPSTDPTSSHDVPARSSVRVPVAATRDETIILPVRRLQTLPLLAAVAALAAASAGYVMHSRESSPRASAAPETAQAPIPSPPATMDVPRAVIASPAPALVEPVAATSAPVAPASSIDGAVVAEGDASVTPSGAAHRATHHAPSRPRGSSPEAPSAVPAAGPQGVHPELFEDIGASPAGSSAKPVPRPLPSAGF